MFIQTHGNEVRTDRHKQLECKHNLELLRHALDMQKMCVVYEHTEAPRSNPGSFQDFDSVHVDIGYCTPTLPSGSLLFILNNSWLKGSGVEPQIKSLILATVWRLSFAMADSVCGVAFSIWLRPSGATAERLAEVIAQVAEQFQAPNFPPHVTLLGNAPKGGKSKDVCGWRDSNLMGDTTDFVIFIMTFSLNV